MPNEGNGTPAEIGVALDQEWERFMEVSEEKKD